jgi:hypothetical protein
MSPQYWLCVDYTLVPGLVMNVTVSMTTAWSGPSNTVRAWRLVDMKKTSDLYCGDGSNQLIAALVYA